jgi:hypothetical protein
MHGFVEKHWKFYQCSPSWSTAPLEVRNYLDANLPHCWIGLATGDNMSLTSWLAWSPDLTPCGFVLCGYVTLDDLKQCITTASAGVDDDMLTRVWQEFDYRLHICRVYKGAYSEHL